MISIIVYSWLLSYLYIVEMQLQFLSVLVQWLEIDTYNFQVFNMLKVNRIVGRVDASKVEADGQASTLAKLDFSEKALMSETVK